MKQQQVKGTLKKILIIITILSIIWVVGCSSFGTCMDFCVDELDGKCNYNSVIGIIESCDDNKKEEIGNHCFNECKGG